MHMVCILLYFIVVLFWSIYACPSVYMTLSQPQSYDCPSALDTTLKNMSKKIQMNLYGAMMQPQQNKAKQN